MGYSLRSVLGRALTWVEMDKNGSWFKGTPPTVVISGGVITVDGHGVYKVDTEGGAATDDLTRINGMTEGERVELHLVSSSRKITIKQSAFLAMEQEQDFELEMPKDSWEGWCHEDLVVSERRRNTNGPR